MKSLKHKIKKSAENAKPLFIRQMRHINNQKAWEAIGVLFIKIYFVKPIKNYLGTKNETNKSF